MENKSGHVLPRLWVMVCIASITVFLICQILMEVDQIFSANPVCRRDIKYSLQTQFANCAQAGGYITTACILLLKIMRDKRCNTNSFENSAAYLCTFSCITLSSLASILTLVWDWGGICVDKFGVYTPGALWGEWLSCAPVLMFITVSIENKPNLSREDITLILAFFLCIFFGFILIFQQPLWLAWIWLLASSICFLSVFKLLYDARRSLKSIQHHMQHQNSEDYLTALEFASRKMNLCAVFGFIVPINVIVYFLAMSGVLTMDGTRLGLILGDMMTKLMFGLLAMDTHTELLHPSTLQLIEEKKANEARRNFLKYIFHEVRVPLNSITMGIECLDTLNTQDYECRETLQMMKEASTFMAITLNDVLDMQKIEEGKLELEMNAFSIQETVESVVRTFSGPFKAKKITVKTNIDMKVPSSLIGDKFRIEHVIANLLSNAVKFSPENSEIIVDVQCKRSFPSLSQNISEITVAVTDAGPGISDEDQKKLFASFMQIRPGELQGGRGSGVGLSICKQVVNLHGGTIGVKSIVKEGSTFMFTIPFAIQKRESLLLRSPGKARVAPSPQRSMLDQELNCVTKMPKVLPSHEDISNPNANISNSSDKIESFVEDKSSPRGVILPSPAIRNSVFHTSTNHLYDKCVSPSLVQSFTGQKRVFQLEEKSSLEDDALMKSYSVEINCEEPNKNVQLLSPSMCECNLSSEWNLKDLKVLIVDDVTSNRKMLNMLLTRKGLTADMAEDGSKAVNMVSNGGNDCRNSQYHMIFMDNMMPIMNGIEATAQLRMRGYPGLIIGLTGCAMEDDISDYLDSGADIVLSKPLQMGQILAILAYVKDQGTVSQSSLIMTITGDQVKLVKRKEKKNRRISSM